MTPGSTCYDLGCSLGAATLAMARGIRGDDVRIVAVDNSPAMIERCRQDPRRERLSTAAAQVELRTEDLRETPVSAMRAWWC